jgi:hypothetical protein
MVVAAAMKGGSIRPLPVLSIVFSVGMVGFRLRVVGVAWGRRAGRCVRSQAARGLRAMEGAI